MTKPHENFAPRRVVVGTNEAGRSTVIYDGPSETRSVTPMWTINDMWQIDSVPPRAESEHSLTPGESILLPPMGGVSWRVTMFPPDRDLNPEDDFAAAMSVLQASDAVDDGEDAPPGMHVTDTLDIVTVISGEMTAIFEEGETVLHPGDTLIQRGTKHAWSNRTSEPCVLAFTMMPALR